VDIAIIRVDFFDSHFTAGTSHPVLRPDQQPARGIEYKRDRRAAGERHFKDRECTPLFGNLACRCRDLPVVQCQQKRHGIALHVAADDRRHTVGSIVHAAWILDPVSTGAEHLDQLSGWGRRIDSERGRVADGRGTGQVGVDAIGLNRGDRFGADGLYRTQKTDASLGRDGPGD
jgi:hypothetical protein